MKKERLIIFCLAMVMAFSVAQVYAAPPVLKVGMPLPLTGVVAESAKEMGEIFKMYLEEHDGKLGGLPTQLFIEDTETQAEMVVTKTRKLVEADQVHVLTGGMLAFEALAMRDIAVNNKIAHCISISTADDLTQRLRTPYVVRTNISSSQETMPFGEYAYNVLGYRKMATIGQDYAWGWETVGGFQFAFEKSGGKILQKLWSPIGTTDYAPFVTQLKGGNYDAVWATLIGADIPRFVQAFQAYGLKDKMALISSEDLVDQDVFRYYGDEAIGIIGATPYNVNLDRPELKKFVAAYQKRSGGTKPTFWGHGAYVSAMYIDRTLQKLQKEGVKLEDLPNVVRNDAVRFTSTLKTIELPDAPSGPIKMTEYNNPIRNIYLVKVVKKDGKIDAIPIHTFPNTTQFWKIDPAKFLSQPVFSRDFPPLTK